MQRDQAIDAIKGFAILLVMLGHCIVLNGLHTTDPYLYDAIKSVQMPLFMVVSGVLLGISFARKQKERYSLLRLGTKEVETELLQRNGNELFKTIDKRAFHYLVPFFSWFLLVYLVTHLAAKTISFSNFCEETYELLMQTDRGLWFFMTLFLITLSVLLSQFLADFYALVFVRLSKRSRFDQTASWVRFLAFLVEILFLYVLFFLQARSGFSFLSPSLTIQYMPYYVCGYVAFGYGIPRYRGFSEGGKRCVQMGVKLSAILSLLLFFYLVVRFDLTLPVDGIGTLLTQMGASFFGTYACFVLLYWGYEACLKRGKTLRFLPFIGQYTLEIYVLHFRFARLLGLSQKNLSFYSAPGILWILAAFLLMSACTAVCIYFFRKSKVLRTLLFGK